jgi:MarR family transcriptional regulator for hemolysin
LALDPPLSQRRNLAFRLGIIARQMRNAFDQSVGAIGVTRSQWSLLVVVSRHPGATQRTIAEALEMTEAATGRAIDRMVQDGLLERRTKPDDRRAHAVHLTAKAEPLLHSLLQIAERNEAVAFAGLDDGELEQLCVLLDRVYANLTKSAD